MASTIFSMRLRLLNWNIRRPQSTKWKTASSNVSQSFGDWTRGSSSEELWAICMHEGGPSHFNPLIENHDVRLDRLDIFRSER